MPLKVVTRASEGDKHDADVCFILYHKGRLYSAGDEGMIKVWNADLSYVDEIDAHESSVFSLAASDETLFSCSNDGTVKSWDLSTLKAKETLIQESDTEFWSLRWADGVLYAGDDQGNVNVWKDEKHYGVTNVAEAVKSIVVVDNLLFTAKDTDVVVSKVKLDGPKLQASVNNTVTGKSPIAVAGNTIVFGERGGKNLMVHQLQQGKLEHITEVHEAHSMIINALVGGTWDDQGIIFSGGWDRLVKKWIVEPNGLKAEGNVKLDLIINTLALGEKGAIYAAGNDGQINCVEEVASLK